MWFKQSKKFLSFFFIFFLLLFFLIFGFNTSDINDSNDSLSDTITKKNVLVRSSGLEPDSLDPVNAQTNASIAVLYDIGEGLMTEDQSNNPIPGVAQSFSMSKDGLEYTFYLRENMKWSNGHDLTAYDFLYSLHRAVDPLTASPVAYKLAPIKNFQLIREGNKNINDLGVKVINERTLKITLDYPCYYFLSILADPITYPIYKPGLDQYGQKFFFPEHYVSNGAYKLTEWVPNGHILLTKNIFYWDNSNVCIDNIKFLPISDRISSYHAYEAGLLDFVMYVPTTNLSLIERKYGTQLKSTQWIGIEYLSFNLTQPPFKNNVNLRKALSLVIDREAIVHYVTKNGALPLYSFFPATIENGIYKDMHYDWMSYSMPERIALAKKLYIESGYSFDKPLTISIEYNTDELHKQVMLAISQMWSDILGVKTVLEHSEMQVFLEKRQSHSYSSIARDGWAADFNTIDNFLNMWTCDSVQNSSGYCDNDYDNFVFTGQQQNGSKKAMPYYVKALNIIMNDYPIIPLYTDSIVHLVNSNIDNYQFEKNNMDHIYDKWFCFKG